MGQSHIVVHDELEFIILATAGLVIVEITVDSSGASVCSRSGL